jgi:hypothetical protein
MQLSPHSEVVFSRRCIIRHNMIFYELQNIDVILLLLLLSQTLSHFQRYVWRTRVRVYAALGFFEK